MPGNIKYVDIGPCWVKFGAIGSEVDLGWTKGGVKVGVKTETSDVEADQETDAVMTTITKRPVSVTTPLMHYTLENLNIALPGSRLFTNAAGLTTSFVGENSNLVFTAKFGGEHPGPGNDIAIQYVNPGVSTASCAVAVNEQTNGDLLIAVTLKHDGSSITATASDIKSAIEADEDAAALISVAHSESSTGAGVVVALTATNLSGGKQKLVGYSASKERLIDYAASLILHPANKEDDDKSEDQWYPKAVAIGTLDITHDKTNPKLINIEFRVFPFGSDNRTFEFGDPTTTEV